MERIFPIRSAVSLQSGIVAYRGHDCSARPRNEKRTDGHCAPDEVTNRLAKSTRIHSEGIKVCDLTDDADESTRDAICLRQATDLKGSENETEHITRVKISADAIRSTRKHDSHQEVAAGERRDQSDSIQAGASSFMHSRYHHIPTEDGHYIVTGMQEHNLVKCESEPIHTPGAIQSFGLLMTLRKSQDRAIIVDCVSENSSDIIGYSPDELFAMENLLTVFPGDWAQDFGEHVETIRISTTYDDEPTVFTTSITYPGHSARKYLCALHISERWSNEVVICELERSLGLESMVLHTPWSTMNASEVTAGYSPLSRATIGGVSTGHESSRRRRVKRAITDDAVEMEILDIVSRVDNQLGTATSLHGMLNLVLDVFRNLTDFHRVMVYQFDPAWNGYVMAEWVDTAVSQDRYAGLHFPASDIPRQARELYRLNKVRLLYDRLQDTARLVRRHRQDLQRSPNLTHAYLRALSPIHLKYLSNMAVRSSMSISIDAFNNLWGLVMCHGYGQEGHRMYFPGRKLCRLLSDTVSRHVEKMSYVTKLQRWNAMGISHSSHAERANSVLLSGDLLELFTAEVGVAFVQDNMRIWGDVTGCYCEVLALMELLRLKKLSAVSAFGSIVADFPDLVYGPGFHALAGFLYIPLSAEGTDHLVFFRKAFLDEVKWAGNPHDKISVSSTGSLEPRHSFQEWSETVVGRCRDWTVEDLEIAHLLCVMYGKFVAIWREQETVTRAQHERADLVGKSADIARQRLDTTMRCLEQVLERPLDPVTRSHLVQSQTAAKSLVFVIDDLLSLTQREKRKIEADGTIFDLFSVMQEATDSFAREARRRNIEYEVHIDVSIPREVTGSARHVRQVVVDLLANAFDNTQKGTISVRAWTEEENKSLGLCKVGISVTDTGNGMSSAAADKLFSELEQVVFIADTRTPHQEGIAARPDKNDIEHENVMGLGIAVIGRAVQTMSGQLRLRTEEGKGSRFTIFLELRSSNTTSAGPT